MITKINRVVALSAILGICGYLVYQNSSDITLRLSSQHAVTANGGIIFISVFGVGFLVACLIGLILGVKVYLRERSYRRREIDRTVLNDTIMRAREFTATTEWGKARSEWERALRRDPTNIISSIELSRVLEKDGETREALRVLEAVRASQSTNVEVLFRAAELNLGVGNKTAALDNLALILYHHPNRRAAVMARTLSEELERFDDALEYQEQLERMGGDAVEIQHLGKQSIEINVRTRLAYHKLMKSASSQPLVENGEARDTAQDLVTRLREFVKRNPTLIEALHSLAELEKNEGNLDAAAAVLARAAKLSHRASEWQSLVTLWIGDGKPDRAIAAARSATKETSGSERISAQIQLIRLQTSLNLFDDSLRSVDELPRIASDEGLTLSAEQNVQAMVAKAIALQRLGKTSEANDTWNKVGQFQSDLMISSDPTRKVLAPSPTLSTP